MNETIPGTKSGSIGGPILAWLQSTPRRSFVLYPIAIILFELAWRGGTLAFEPWGVPLLLWGYLQYRLTGHYRRRLGGGGPGTAVPPARLVGTGLYRFMRNPMYLGHLIFLLGLAILLRSWAGCALFAIQAVWFHRRVLHDEARLTELFGQSYVEYARRVPSWIPGIG